MSIREGYLTKQGGNIKTWKRRWFCLGPDFVLRYYTNVGAEMKGEFSLKSAGEIKAVNIKKKFPHCLEVQTPNRHYRMSADNEESMEKWLVALKHARDGTTEPQEPLSPRAKVDSLQWNKQRAAADAEALRLRKEAEAAVDAAVWSLEPSSSFPAPNRSKDVLADNGFPRLLHFQGHKQAAVTITHVPTSSANLNECDVFVLDNFKTVYTWMGTSPNMWQQTAAATLTRALDDERGSDVLNLILSDPMGSDAEEFWRLLGGQPDVLSKAAPEPFVPAVFRLSDASGQLEFDEVGRGQGISLRLLDPNDVFVVDLGFHVFVWIGQKASRAERDQAPAYARAYVRRYNRPEHLHVERVMDGGENELLCAFLSGH